MSQNILKEFEDGFSAQKNYVFDITQMPLLEIAAKCKVVIVPATGQQVKVAIDADPEISRISRSHRMVTRSKSATSGPEQLHP